MYCQACGKQISSTAEICPRCGIRVEHNPEAERDAAQKPAPNRRNKMRRSETRQGLAETGQNLDKAVKDHAGIKVYAPNRHKRNMALRGAESVVDVVSSDLPTMMGLASTVLVMCVSIAGVATCLF